VLLGGSEYNDCAAEQQRRRRRRRQTTQTRRRWADVVFQPMGPM